MRIREDFERSITDKSYTYSGTLIQGIPPQLAARVTKAIRKEKNWFDHGRWKYSRNTQLISTYNSEDFTLTIKLEAFRKNEIIQEFLRKML